MNEPYLIIQNDISNPTTHVIIEVRGEQYSVAIGLEQQTANEIAKNLG